MTADSPAELLTDVRRPDPRVRWLWIAKRLLSAIVVGTGLAVASVLGPGWTPLGGVAVGAVLALIGAGHAHLLYRSWSYELRSDALYLDRGVYREVRTVVPFVRVQHVDTARGPIERALGLSSLVVYTAGSRGADVTVPGLTVEEATDCQERLKRLTEATSDGV